MWSANSDSSALISNAAKHNTLHANGEPLLKQSSSYSFFHSSATILITPHVQRERGKVIGVCVHIYIYYICGQQKILNRTLAIDSPFSNIRGRTSRQIYRIALPLLSPATISSSSKSRIFLYNVHLALFVQMDDTITRANESVSFIT